MTKKQELLTSIAQKSINMDETQKSDFRLYILGEADGREVGRRMLLQELEKLGINIPSDLNNSSQAAT